MCNTGLVWLNLDLVDEFWGTIIHIELMCAFQDESQAQAQAQEYRVLGYCHTLTPLLY